MSGFKDNPNDIAIVSFPGASHEFLEAIHKGIQEAVGSDGGIVLITAEEIKVTDLTRLKAQLVDLLGLVNKINQARAEDE